ncbi:BadF/BadG/BcrA/BcrD ATPase family protein [Antarctobacter jejuensis]|uniref:BadF/BadG/BcrA/BcrD ATPase family protein n=1 Tax=Antarctobacter jejuensis TaxID=1439938 RepID=UPI003FCF7653
MMNVAYDFLIAVDGGGSGCRALVADGKGHVLGRGKSGPANVTTDVTQAARNVRQAIEGACAEAEVGPTDCIGAHLGLAGALTPALQAQVAEAVGLPRATVSDDLDTMLAGALGGADGVLAAIGTGSVLAAHRRGKVRRVGGWGLQVSDQASGAWLGRALLEQVLLSHDGLSPHSDLTRTLGDEMGGALGIVGFAATARPADYAALAPRIVAASGDATATALMARGADYLLRGIEALDWQPGEALCLSGGLGPAYAALLPERMRAAMVSPKGTALDGALLLAQRLREDAT